MAQRKALGRGLSALLGSTEVEPEQLREIDLDRILPNSHQPRKNFDEETLNELADSIREHGVVQPILVRALEEGFFQLIAGERRWRASQRAGLVRIPAVIRDTRPVTMSSGTFSPSAYPSAEATAPLLVAMAGEVFAMALAVAASQALNRMSGSPFL